VQDYVQSLALTVKNTFGADSQHSVITEIDNINLDIDTLIPCGLIMNEILTNAYKHAFNEHDNPEIKVVMKQLEDNNISLSISDNGIGLPDGFDVTQNTGLGLQLVNTLISQINGTLEVRSENGTEFTIIFPNNLEFSRHNPGDPDD
jgi:two-component sensor histidine kinase